MATTVPIDFDGSDPVVELVAANARNIIPKRLVLTFSADTTVAFASGGTMLTGPMEISGGGAIVIDFAEDLETAQNEALNLVQTGTAAFGGWLSYKLS